MKNHLFIGLGGQGGHSIAALRKVIDQRNRDEELLKASDVDWDFLYIDSSPDVASHAATWAHFGKNLSLPPRSIFKLKGTGTNLDPSAISIKPDVAPWIGDKKLLLSCFEDDQDPGVGANQKRRFGRLLFANRADRIRDRLEQKVTPLTEQANQCAFHIFASLAGGTGSGCIVDLVTMIRTYYPNSSIEDGFPIFLYLFVTSKDNRDSKVGYFHENQLCCLRDLNALACGKFRPTLLGADHGGKPFKGVEPISQIILNTDLNDRNQYVNIEQQHKIIAEAAFERIYSYCSGKLKPKQRKSLTGEDCLKNFKGEPEFNHIRSFRFGALGMRRWEIPVEKIKELIAKAIYTSSLRQMLYQNWNEQTGYLNEKTSRDNSGVTLAIEEAKTRLQQDLLENKELPSLIADLKKELEQSHAGFENKGFSSINLQDYESSLTDRCKAHLRGVGIASVCAGIQRQRKARLIDLVANFHLQLQKSWTRATDPIGLAYFPEIISALQHEIAHIINQIKSKREESNQGLRNRIEARKIEWEKTTFLSGKIIGKKLAIAHRHDLEKVLSWEIRCHMIDEDLELLDEVILELGAMGQAYSSSITKIEEWLKKAEWRRDELAAALYEINAHDTANKYEINANSLKQYLRHQNTNHDLLKNIADQLRNLIARSVGTSRTLDHIRKITGDSEEQFWLDADAFVYSQIESAHADIVAQNELSPVLTSSLMDSLEARYDEDPEGFKKEIHAFITQASCCARIDESQNQPKVLQGKPGMPEMPRKIMVVGMPRGHSFSGRLASLIEPLLPGDDDIEPGFYEHEDPTQIRLLVSISWMAARFASISKQLEDIYSRTIAQNINGDVAYFSNIDEEGRLGRRASLVLPSTSDSIVLLQAALWIGKNIEIDDTGTKLIKESGGLFTVLRKRENGFDRINLGSSPDIIQITSVIDSVTNCIADLPGETRRSLIDLHDSENRPLDPHSDEFVAWNSKRDQIINLLDL
jgi:hypothetical protein